jgi:plastocyanin
MTRRPALLTLTALAGFVAFTALVLALRAVPAPAAAAFPARLQAVTTEFRLTLSRIRVPAGRVRIELVNYGEDPHDLKLRRVGGTRVYTIPETAPGERTTRTFRLRAGRYRVWCAIADHEAMGMRALLRAYRR